MNTQLFDFITSLSYVGRCPSRREFLNGAPVEQRAIRARWKEIRQTEPIGSPAWREAVANLDYTRPELLLIDNKNPCDRNDVLESAQSQFLRGEIPGPDTAEDQGL